MRRLNPFMPTTLIFQILVTNDPNFFCEKIISPIFHYGRKKTVTAHIICTATGLNNVFYLTAAALRPC